jgi:uncharacterized protein YajQ (UPF0234 family)
MRVAQANKEITNRFDFKGSDARVEQGENTLTLFADDEFKLNRSRRPDRQADQARRRRPLARARQDRDDRRRKAKQVITVKVGVDQALAKKIVALIKESKLKVQSSIQGDAVRVLGAKRDDLQSVIALVKKSIDDFPLQYGNFRD